MRGEDITPWQTYYIASAKTERQERSEPMVDIKLPKIKLAQRLPETNKDYNTVRKVSCRRHNLSKTNKIDEVFKEVKEMGRNNQCLKDKQQSLKNLINQVSLIALIKQEIKKQQSQLNFLELLKKQEEEQRHLRIEAQSATERLTGKDRTSFTRLIEKNIFLLNTNEEAPRELRLSKRQQSAEVIKQILKKEISLMISNRMKIKGKVRSMESSETTG